MFSKKEPANGHTFSAGLEGGTTLVARNTCVKGELVFEEELYIKGLVEGDVTAGSAKGSSSANSSGSAKGMGDAKKLESENAKLVICEGGRVVGEIRAPHVVIDGTVEGDVYATDKLELAGKAKVLGNVHYNLVEMHLGSAVNGQMVSLKDSPEAAMSKEELARQKMREAVGDVVTGIR